MAGTGIQEIIEFSPWAKVRQALRQVWRGQGAILWCLVWIPSLRLVAIQPWGQKVTSLVLENCSLVQGNRSWLYYAEKVSSFGVTGLVKKILITDVTTDLLNSELSFSWNRRYPLTRGTYGPWGNKKRLVAGEGAALICFYRVRACVSSAVDWAKENKCCLAVSRQINPQ